MTQHAGSHAIREMTDNAGRKVGLPEPNKPHDVVRMAAQETLTVTERYGRTTSYSDMPRFKTKQDLNVVENAEKAFAQSVDAEMLHRDIERGKERRTKAEKIRDYVHKDVNGEHLNESSKLFINTIDNAIEEIQASSQQKAAEYLNINEDDPDVKALKQNAFNELENLGRAKTLFEEMRGSTHKTFDQSSCVAESFTELQEKARETGDNLATWMRARFSANNQVEVYGEAIGEGKNFWSNAQDTGVNLSTHPAYLAKLDKVSISTEVKEKPSGPPPEGGKDTAAIAADWTALDAIYQNNTPGAAAGPDIESDEEGLPHSVLLGNNGDQIQSRGPGGAVVDTEPVTANQQDALKTRHDNMRSKTIKRTRNVLDSTRNIGKIRDMEDSAIRMAYSGAELLEQVRAGNVTVNDTVENEIHLRNGFTDIMARSVQKEMKGLVKRTYGEVLGEPRYARVKNELADENESLIERHGGLIDVVNKYVNMKAEIMEGDSNVDVRAYEHIIRSETKDAEKSSEKVNDYKKAIYTEVAKRVEQEIRAVEKAFEDFAVRELTAGLRSVHHYTESYNNFNQARLREGIVPTISKLVPGVSFPSIPL